MWITIADCCYGIYGTAGTDLIVDSKKCLPKRRKKRSEAKEEVELVFAGGRRQVFLNPHLERTQKGRNYSVMCGCEFYVPL